MQAQQSASEHAKQANTEAGSSESASHQSYGEQSGLGEGLLLEAKALFDEYRRLGREHIRLAALETRQAGESAVRMVISGVVAGGVAFIAWASLVGAMVAAVVEQGWLSVSLTLLLTGILHVGMLLVLAYVIRKQGRGLLFSAIVRDFDPRLTGEVGDIRKPESMDKKQTSSRGRKRTLRSQQTRGPSEPDTH
ncbi:MAG: phage holin family protein [Idiomarina sp.]|nr:phage holin family protein [Idiomarina sp.]